MNSTYNIANVRVRALLGEWEVGQGLLRWQVDARGGYACETSEHRQTIAHREGRSLRA